MKFFFDHSHIEIIRILPVSIIHFNQLTKNFLFTALCQAIQEGGRAPQPQVQDELGCHPDLCALLRFCSIKIRLPLSMIF